MKGEAEDRVHVYAQAGGFGKDELGVELARFLNSSVTISVFPEV